MSYRKGIFRCLFSFLLTVAIVLTSASIPVRGEESGKGSEISISLKQKEYISEGDGVSDENGTPEEDGATIGDGEPDGESASVKDGTEPLGSDGLSGPADGESQTGDTSALVPVMLMPLLSGAVCVYIIWIRRKRRQTKTDIPDKNFR